MKRKTILIVATALLVALSAILVACNRQGEEQTPSDISRITESYYAGESELFAVSIESGRREKQFIADGKATDVGPFTELKLTPLKACEQSSLSYVISAGEKTLEGTLSQSDRGEYVDLITLDFAPEKIVVTAGEESSEIELGNVLEGAITAEEAIDIAREEFKDKLQAEADEGKSREVYVKLISGDRMTYYYYVSFIGDGVNYLAALISPDGEIQSKRS